MYLKNNLLILFLTFFFLLVINFFFYSVITISLYKFICYDTNTNTFFFTFFLDKQVSVLYFFFSIGEYFFLCFDSYRLFGVFFPFRLNSFFFFMPFLNIELMYLFFDNFYVVTSNVSDLVFLNFYIRCSNLNWIYTISLQKTIILNFNETSLFFFRIYNPSHYTIKLITLYMIYPNDLSLYINKIQCFCFNVMFLFPMELIDLPVLLYVLPFGFYFFDIFLNNIIIYYVVFLS